MRCACEIVYAFNEYDWFNALSKIRLKCVINPHSRLPAHNTHLTLERRPQQWNMKTFYAHSTLTPKTLSNGENLSINKLIFLGSHRVVCLATFFTVVVILFNSFGSKCLKFYMFSLCNKNIDTKKTYWALRKLQELWIMSGNVYDHELPRKMGTGSFASALQVTSKLYWPQKTGGKTRVKINCLNSTRSL